MFAIPSLVDLVQKMRAAFKAELPGTDAWLPLNNVGPTAKIFGGGLWELFGRLDWVADQAFVLTADTPYLERHGEQYGLIRKPAALATGNVALTTTDAVTVSVNARFTRSDGLAFLASSAASATAAGTIAVPVTAEAAGSAANTPGLAPLTVVSGLTGPGASGAIATLDANGVTGGLDLEDLEVYRARLLFRLRNPPMGGAPADYVDWASTVPGVTRVFVERRWNGNGTVRVFPLFDTLFAGGIPDAPSLTAVSDALAAVAPADAAVTVAAPTATTIPVQITGLSPDTPAVRAAIAAELADTFRRNGQVAGGDTANASMPFLAVPFTFSRSWVVQAVANATGETRHILNLPAADVTIPSGSIPVLGAISYV